MQKSPDRITILRPDDWHVHLRDGAMLAGVVAYTARQFARAIVMPNLAPPVTTTALAAAYRDRILAALPPGADFTPLMTCYLTDATDPDDLRRGFAEGVFTAAKLYPAHATTGSAHGVTDVAHIRAVLERMQEIDMPLLIHGEVTDPDVDIFDREAVFIARTLAGLVRDFPALRIVFEHITTADAVAFVDGSGPNVAARHVHLSAQGLEVEHLFGRHLVRNDQHDTVALGTRHQGQAEPRVAGSGLDHGTTFAQPSVALGSFDHRAPDTVFD